MLILGIDDAGRGPVIGPMCLAGCLIYREIEDEFRRAGIKDSKLLTAKKRGELVPVIKQTALAWDVQILTPAEIIERFLPVLHVNEESLSRLKNGSPIFESMLVERKDIKKAEDAKKRKGEEKEERFAVFCGEKLVEIAVSTKQFKNPEIIAKPVSVLL